MLRTITNIKEHHLHCQRSSLITLLPFRPKDWEKLKQKLRQKDIEKFGIKTPALNCKQHLRQKRLCTSTGFRNERERSKYWPQFQDAHLNVFWYSEARAHTHASPLLTVRWSPSCFLAIISTVDTSSPVVFACCYLFYLSSPCYDSNDVLIPAFDTFYYLLPSSALYYRLITDPLTVSYVGAYVGWMCIR